MAATSFPRTTLVFAGPTSPSTGLRCDCDTLESGRRSSDILNLNIVGRTDEDFAITAVALLAYFLWICWKFEEVNCNEPNSRFHNDS